jgi:hypothetical protein
MTDPTASITDEDTKFSEGMSSRPWCMQWQEIIPVSGCHMYSRSQRPWKSLEMVVAWGKMGAAPRAVGTRFKAIKGDVGVLSVSA